MPPIPLLVLIDIGRVIAEARKRARWTQRELSRRSGVSQPEICRIERGRSPGVRLVTVDRLLSVPGVRYRIDFDLPGAPIRQRDLVHAWGLGALRRRSGRMTFEVLGEVEIGGDRSRGWIDLLGYRSSDRLLVLGEFKSDLLDVGELERQVGWYEREVIGAAKRRGWHPRRVLTVAFLLASEANDAAVRANSVLLGQAFPGRAKDLGLRSLETSPDTVAISS